MADIADQAAQQNELADAATLRTYRRAEGPTARGQCYNCGEVLTGAARWCDEDCREDWERRQ